MVGALNDYQKELQFRKLNATKEDRTVEVVRDGKERVISVYDLVVGDICLLKPGEIIPVDGVFLSGYNVQCDESSATGESDLIKKAPYEECMAATPEAKKRDPFLLSGSKVAEGAGRYICIGVGQRSFLGRIMMREWHSLFYALNIDGNADCILLKKIVLTGEEDDEEEAIDPPSSDKAAAVMHHAKAGEAGQEAHLSDTEEDFEEVNKKKSGITPLQMKLNRLAGYIAKLGAAAGLILFGSLMIRFFTQLDDPGRDAQDKAQGFINILIIAVTIVVVAVRKCASAPTPSKR